MGPLLRAVLDGDESLRLWAFFQREEQNDSVATTHVDSFPYGELAAIRAYEAKVQCGPQCPFLIRSRCRSRTASEGCERGAPDLACFASIFLAAEREGLVLMTSILFVSFLDVTSLSRSPWPLVLWPTLHSKPKVHSATRDALLLSEVSTGSSSVPPSPIRFMARPG
ncbi:hypothetical protein VTK73DRAFT_424 [Phialemonium thermophilum]|uniref:Uncharacterized protein n=1 Tax=Phialemonium thermophilum TaxID=223376 RepID=A0ABR3VV80_9PEZI